LNIGEEVQPPFPISVKYST